MKQTSTINQGVTAMLITQFNSSSVLSMDQMRRKAPSIFAERPWKEVSDKYQFIPTIAIVQEMQTRGFQPVYAFQSRCRIPGKSDFTRHIVRFAVPNLNSWKVGDTRPELMILNSHDRTSIYEISAGFYRLICSNGMTTSEGFAPAFKTRHSGDIKNDVIEATYKVMDYLPKIGGKILEFQGIELSPEEENVFAKSALQLKYENEEQAPIPSSSLLRVQRAEDRPRTLWNCYNRVQENLLRGGLRGRTQTNRKTRTRAVTSINEDLRLNRALWSLAEEMAKLKA